MRGWSLINVVVRSTWETAPQAKVGTACCVTFYTTAGLTQPMAGNLPHIFQEHQSRPDGDQSTHNLPKGWWRSFSLSELQ